MSKNELNLKINELETKILLFENDLQYVSEQLKAIIEFLDISLVYKKGYNVIKKENNNV